MKTNRPASSHRGITGFQLLFAVALLLILVAVIMPPYFLRASKDAHKAQALKNAREIGIAFLDFKEQYNDYPSRETEAVLAAKENRLPPSQQDDANSYLAQLLIAGSIDSEKVFFFRNFAGYQEGDNQFESPQNTLEKGENCFGYVMLSNGETVNGEGATLPIITAPLINGGTDPIFDPKPFKGKAVYLRNDTSAMAHNIDGDGRVVGTRAKPTMFYKEIDPKTKLRLDVKKPRALRQVE